MSPKSIGFDVRAVWLDTGAHGRVWFAFPDLGVVAVVTMSLDGTALGCELHVDGTAASYPPYGIDDFEYETPPGPLNDLSIGARTMREIPWGELVTVARPFLRAEAELRLDVMAQRGDHGLAQIQERALREPGRRPGRRGHADEHFAQLAVAYEEWQRANKPLAALAEQFSYSESGLRAAIATARRKGFLTPTQRGRAGGEATNKAKELLRRSGRQADDNKS